MVYLIAADVLTGNTYVGAVSPQLMFVCRWYALLLARSVNTQLALYGA
jgi:hypothetical protein